MTKKKSNLLVIGLAAGVRIKISRLLLSSKAHLEKRKLFLLKNRRALASGTSGSKRKITNPKQRKQLPRNQSLRRNQASKVLVHPTKKDFTRQKITSRCCQTKSLTSQSNLKANRQKERRSSSPRSLPRENKSPLKKSLGCRHLRIKNFCLEIMNRS